MIRGCVASNTKKGTAVWYELTRALLLWVLPDAGRQQVPEAKMTANFLRLFGILDDAGLIQKREIGMPSEVMAFKISPLLQAVRFKAVL